MRLARLLLQYHCLGGRIQPVWCAALTLLLKAIRPAPGLQHCCRLSYTSYPSRAARLALRRAGLSLLLQAALVDLARQRGWHDRVRAVQQRKRLAAHPSRPLQLLLRLWGRLRRAAGGAGHTQDVCAKRMVQYLRPCCAKTAL